MGQIFNAIKKCLGRWKVERAIFRLEKRFFCVKESRFAIGLWRKIAWNLKSLKSKDSTMAMVSADKLREMEAEMDRFEQEIALPGMSPQMMDFHRPIIGAGTYNQQIADQFSKHFGQSQGDYNLAPLHFIPHSLQRNTTSIDNNVPTTTYQSSQTTSGPVIPGTGPYIEAQPVLVTSHVIQSPPSPEAKPGPVVITGAPAIYAAPPVRAKPKVEDVYIRKDIRLDSSYQRFASNDVDFMPKHTDMPSSSMSIGVTAPKHVGPTIVPSYLTDDHSGKKKEKKKKIVRLAGGSAWEDPSLLEWEQDDFRIFCGDLGNDVTDEVLTRAFGRYPSFMKAKVIRDKRNNKTKGYGFVSFKDPQDFIRAMKEMNGKYVGSRPIKLRKSTWRDRNVEVVKKKMKEKQRLGLR